MIALVKVSIVFLFLLVLLWRKVGVGKALLLCAALLGIIFLIPSREFLMAVGKGVFGWDTWFFILLLVGIMVFGGLLRLVGSFDKVVGSLEGLTGDSRSVVTLIPAFIGFLPMPGGALLSAYMMDDAGSNMGLSGERKAAVNFWFRHIWEAIFPLYPGIVVVASLMNVPLGKVILMNIPISVSMIIAGVAIYLPMLPAGKISRSDRASRGEELMRLFAGVWPVAAVILLTPLARLVTPAGWISTSQALVLSVLVMLAVVIIVYRIGAKKLAVVLRDRTVTELVWLAFGIMVFRSVMDASGAIEAIPEFLSGKGVSTAMVLFSVPLGVGLLTGNTVAYVASTFPLLSGLMMQGGEVDYRMMFLAFSGGFVGMLLSPVHLCFALTKEYFKAPWGKLYALMAPGVGLLVVTSAAAYLWGARWLAKL